MKRYFIIISVLVLALFHSFTFAAPASKKAAETKPLVTLIELGSVRCVPCRMMQPILDEIAKEYEGKVEVVFYDVWTKEGRHYAAKYRINMIPVQVFLDKDGKEYYRHAGFLPKDDIVRVLRLRGVK